MDRECHASYLSVDMGVTKTYFHIISFTWVQSLWEDADCFAQLSVIANVTEIFLIETMFLQL